MQNIPQKWPTKNSTKQLPKISDHLCENDSAPFHQNGLCKTSPKNSQPRIPQNSLPRFSTIFAKIIKTRFGHFSKTSPKNGQPRIP